jgi:DNA-binding transcriptional ArsR family regulator
VLKALCGNKNIERILMFLHVNNKCYGTQLHKALDVPLTPLQKALSRLEDGSIINSYFEGKTRYYRFNPAHPLYAEIDLLLKKAYSLLPPEERELYTPMKESRELADEEKMITLHTFWTRLVNVTQLDFEAKSQSTEQAGWNGKGKGKVFVAKDKNTLIFTERGSWKNRQNQEVGFSNVFRWTFNEKAGVISLEHLRQGPNHPVELFKLAPSGKQTLSSIDSHLCGGDLYFGQIHIDPNSLRLNWRVIGPKKNEEIDYYYS